MMFDGYDDEGEIPTEADVGKFIPRKEMETWWKSLQKKYPSIYPASEPCPECHPQGAKLMCYIDDNPEKPLRVEVVGTKWRKDKRMGKQLMYIILEGGKYQETEFSSAHEEDPEVGWLLGWDAPCPEP